MLLRYYIKPSFLHYNYISAAKSIKYAKMYRSLCIIVLFAFSASSFSIRETVDTEEHKCNVTEEFIFSLIHDPETVMNNLETRCTGACWLIKTHSLKPDGTLNTALLIEVMPKNVINRDEVAAAYNLCANQTGKDICETAYNSFTCVNSQEVIRNVRLSGPEQ